jgi:hypothetical protein
MKHLSEIIFFSIISLLLTSSCAYGSCVLNEPDLKTAFSINADTTVSLNLLKIDTFKLTIVPPSSGVQFYKDRIVFLSLSKNEKKMSPNQISFGSTEAYYAAVEDSVVGKHKIFSPLLSFSYPCEAMTFSRDYNTVYFTKIPKRDKREKIFMAKFTSNSKNETELIIENSPVDFCSENANYSHPALSFDGDMMIFASDKAGSFGGMDLYISRKVDEKWSLPQNLGKSINTSGNEFFPFLDSQNNLYFSSDGLPGYGGFDIFTCKFNGTDWDKPVNLTDHINSANDDIAFTINRLDGKIAFFSRRSQSGNSEMQLFRIKLKQDAVNQNQLTLAEIFNGKPGSKFNLTASLPAEKEKSAESEAVRPKPENEVVKEEETEIPETLITAKKLPEKKKVNNPEPAVSSSMNKPVPEIKPAADEQKDVIIYKVQVLPSTSQIKAGEMVLNGATFKINVYTYLGAVRYTIGEFRTLTPASALQRICKQEGNSGAFVAAFKNGARSEIVKKEEVNKPETLTSAHKLPEKETVSKPESEVSSSVNNPLPEIKHAATGQKDVIIYRVQVLPSSSQIKAGEMVLNGTTYKIYAYTYLGAVRYTIGEFSTSAQASALQRICKQEGNSGAFVAAFKNGTRSMDPNLNK